MKIWCDVCNKQKATLFCSADEAALCDECDSRVHEANKLASKHHRFSLLHSSSTDAPPTCDICQEKKALLFCQQDRAILCGDCDASIHTRNEHTQKHSRFVLTGVKLSSTSTTKTSIPHYVNDPLSGCTSSISEYLIDILPGWRVEDLLDSSSEPDGFFKGSDNDLVFLDSDPGSSWENMWVPQAPPVCEMLKGRKASSSKRMAHGGFTVPEMTQLSNKRSRPFY